MAVRCGSRIATDKYRLGPELVPGRYGMNEHLMNIPTDSLIDMLFAILTGEFAPTAYEGAEIEQILHELHSRGESQWWTVLSLRGTVGVSVLQSWRAMASSMSSMCC